MNDQNKNSILSTILVFVIGIIGLSLLFGFISGNGVQMNGNMIGESDMMGGRTTAGYSFGTTLTGLLVLLIKLSTIALVIVFVIGVIVWLKDVFFKNTSFRISGLVSNDPIMKLIVYGSLAILSLTLILALFCRYGYTGMSMNTMAGSFSYNQSYGFAGLIGTLIKLFTFILVTSLTIASIIYLKNQLDHGTLFSQFRNMTQQQQQQQDPTSTLSSTGDTDKAPPTSPSMQTKDLDQIKSSGEAAGTTQLNHKNK